MFFPFSIYDVTKDEFGTFDAVLFLGVIYHLAHPLLALENINRVLKKDGVMVIESEISKTITRFYNKSRTKHSSKGVVKKQSVKSAVKNKIYDFVRNISEDPVQVFTKDPSVFWVPTKTELKKFVDHAGFAIEKTIEDRGTHRITYVCRKVEELDPTYAAESQYTHYKNRTSNFHLK